LLVRQEVTMINPFNVMKECEQYFHLKPGSIVKPDRHKTVLIARSVAMYITRQLCQLSYTEIGEYFDRDHKCVINNCKKIVKLAQTLSYLHVKSAIIVVTGKLHQNPEVLDE